MQLFQEQVQGLFVTPAYPVGQWDDVLHFVRHGFHGLAQWPGVWNGIPMFCDMHGRTFYSPGLMPFFA